MAKPGWRARKRANAAQRGQGAGSPMPQGEIGAQGGAENPVALPWSPLSLPERMGRPQASGIPLALRAAALRVPLAQVLAALSQVDAGLREKVAQVDMSDHPNAAKLYEYLGHADIAFAQWYHRLGVALACVAPGQEGGK